MAGRQPVHVVYGGAHLFRAETARKMGDLARRALDEHAPSAKDLAKAVDHPSPKRMRRIYPRILEKLEREPVEDFRLDFEDGFGPRPDAEEDAVAASAAREMARGLADGKLPPFCGIRIKALDQRTEQRGQRTLEIFLRTLLDATGGTLPPNFVVTLPKITSPSEVSRLVSFFEDLEGKEALPPGSLRLELMIETPALLIDTNGTCPLPWLVEASQSRCVGAHFGAFDYTAALGIAAGHQTLDHPACDFARHVMKVALSSSGIFLSDGSNTLLPLPVHRATAEAPLTDKQRKENRSAVHRAWKGAWRWIRNALRNGYYQGWDLHPAQLPVRYAATYDFFLEGLDASTERMRRFLERAAQAVGTGGVVDDAATGRGLLNHFRRGYACGALTADDVAAAGLAVEELEIDSFSRLLERRRP